MTGFDVSVDALEVRFRCGLDLLELFAEAQERGMERTARDNTLCAIQLYLRTVDRELRNAVDRRFRFNPGCPHQPADSREAISTGGLPITRPTRKIGRGCAAAHQKHRTQEEGGGRHDGPRESGTVAQHGSQRGGACGGPAEKRQGHSVSR